LLGGGFGDCYFGSDDELEGCSGNLAIIGGFGFGAIGTGIGTTIHE